MRRDTLKRWMALVGIIVVIAVLGLRFDFGSLLLLFEDTPPAPVKMQRVTANKRLAPVEGSIVQDRLPGVHPEQKPAGDDSTKPATTFDVVRIAPDGVSVFAGRAPANALVTVMANGKPVATATADSNGEWSIVVDRQYAPGQISFR